MGQKWQEEIVNKPKLYALHGAGFVLYEPEEVDLFLAALQAQSDLLPFEYSSNYEFVEDYEHMGLFDGRVTPGQVARFTDLRGTFRMPEVMLVVETPLKPCMYDAPFSSKAAFRLSVMNQIDAMGFTDLLPEDFDWDAHIGYFDYVR